MASESGRYLVWDAMCEFATRIQERAKQADLTVEADRRRRLGAWRVEEGLWIGNLSTDVFEPVRWRRFFSKEWIEIQSVPSAAAAIGEFLRERPDLK
ncbi:MAG: hypothetical protein OER95_08065 [Acidimicrobiia bacterium]|nr:hypothetical protein [Acidimicrobiia bacterium]